MSKKKQKPECEKCGEKRIRSCFHGVLYCCWSTCGNYSDKEHLHYFCPTCRNDWTGPVKKDGKKILIKPYPPSGTTAKSFHTLISPKKPVKVNLI